MTEPLKVGSPRTIAACYYAFMSLITMLGLHLLLFWIGMQDMLPVLASTLLAPPIGFIAGGVFGKRILLASTNARCFLWGMLLIVFALPLYDLLLLSFLKQTFPQLEKLSHTTTEHFMVYGIILVYSIVLIGSWLSILSGFAALHLKNTFVIRLRKYSNNLNNQYKNHQGTNGE